VSSIPFILEEAPVTSHTSGSKPVNGNEKHPADTAKKAAMSTSEDIQDDLQALQEDVVRLTQQLAKFASAKGGEAWGLAKDNLDDVLGGAKAKGRDAADAVSEVRDNLACAIEESLDKRPYTTLALVLAAGFVVGAIWKR
jgi:ElaB/YqjD/DUF883 family membrane-anchored ribosome-binding protein